LARTFSALGVVGALRGALAALRQCSVEHEEDVLTARVRASARSRRTSCLDGRPDQFAVPMIG
jgi:hypothetical protein